MLSPHVIFLCLEGSCSSGPCIFWIGYSLVVHCGNNGEKEHIIVNFSVLFSSWINMTIVGLLSCWEGTFIVVFTTRFKNWGCMFILSRSLFSLVISPWLTLQCPHCCPPTLLPPFSGLHSPVFEAQWSNLSMKVKFPEWATDPEASIPRHKLQYPNGNSKVAFIFPVSL